ncbi:MAG: hypothetical protein WD009_05120 [Phycisphaeraceae bacterium]
MVGRNIWRLRRGHRRDVRSDVDQLRRDLTRVRDDVGELVGALVQAGRQTSDQTTQRVRQQVHERLDRIGAGYQSARDTGDRAMNTAREHPLVSAIAAVAVGLIVAGLAAMLMRR